MTEPRCPYCNVTLKREPKARSKCKACDQWILVKYSPSDRVKRLMTTVQAAEVDAAWAAHHEDKCITEFCRMWGADEALLRAGIKEIGNTEAVMETELRFVLATNVNMHMRKMAASNLANIEGKRGGPFVPMIREARRYELLGLPRIVIKRVTIAAGRCARSRELAGRMLTIDKALEEKPLPHLQCEAKSQDGRPGFCTCYYQPVIESLEQA